MISYAQNFEDVMLWRALRHVGKGFYIDIGAQDPVVDSVSLAFYEQGWRGVHVEPAAVYADAVRAARPDETVIQAAVGSKGGILEFFEVVDTGLSTGDRAIADKHREAGFTVRSTTVPCVTLGGILDRYVDRDIHWLKIDVEGLEKDVLEGWRPSAVRPWIVVVESTAPMTQIETHGQWEQLILDLGYQAVYFDGLNRFYLSAEHADLAEHFRVGPNYFDDFVLSGTGGRFCSLLTTKLHEQEEALAHGRHELQYFREENQRVYAQLQEQCREAGSEREQRARAEEDRNRLQCELDRVYASTSWRATRPLRAAATRLRPLRARLRGAPRRLARVAIGTARSYFAAHPEQKQQLLRLIAAVPGLSSRLRRLTQRATSDMASPLSVPGEPADHPASVQHIYARLQEARDRARDTNGHS